MAELIRGRGWDVRPWVAWVVSMLGAALVLVIKNSALAARTDSATLPESVALNGAVLVIMAGLSSVLCSLKRISSNIGIPFDHRPAAAFDDLHAEARRLLGEAKDHIRIINRWPDDRPGKPEASADYYKDLEAFLARDRLTRVLQVPAALDGIADADVVRPSCGSSTAWSRTRTPSTRPG